VFNCEWKILREELMSQVKMKVNGREVSAETEGRTLLSSYLRDLLGLTGTHVGCDTSQCGACVVLVDGKAVKSCTAFAADLEGAEVTTVEGMANPDGSLGRIQQAFQDYHGLQCGFCTPGMVMSTAALLADNPKPSEEEVRHYLEGNICRCTGYQNIVRAVMAASGQDAGALAAE
jgi:carbon-monoxide dehydrogenase small subunit